MGSGASKPVDTAGLLGAEVFGPLRTSGLSSKLPTTLGALDTHEHLFVFAIRRLG